MAAQNGSNGQARDRSRSPARNGYINGYTAKGIFEDPKNMVGYTFDDLICMPGQINFGVHDVSTETRFTKRIKLKVPLVSSPMDTVTESRMAIGMALMGGIGVIHRNLDTAEQCEEVRRVKSYRAGMIMEPVCLQPGTTLQELFALEKRSGFSGFPVTEDGRVGSRLLGVVSKRDKDLIADQQVTVGQVMTPREDLIVAEQGIDLQAAHRIIKDSKKGKLPIVSKDDKLVGFIVRKDLEQAREYPNTTTDGSGSLRVAAAVGSSADDKDRVKALAAAGVDAVVMPHKQGDSQAHLDMIRWIKKEFPDLEVVGGNVVTRAQAKRLLRCGVDAIRVGMGIGSMSVAQEVCACGRAQASAVYHVAAIASRVGVPVVADGGMGGPGQILKALTLGADTAMCGSALAGTEESAGEYVFAGGRRLKRYRGMMSNDVIVSSDDKFSHLVTGVSGTVMEKGPLQSFIPYLEQGLKHGMQDLGVKSIEGLHTMLREGELLFEIRSAAAQREGGIHGLFSYENKLYTT